MNTYSSPPKTSVTRCPSAATWRADLDALLVLHPSGFAVRFSPCASETCPSCCIIVKHGRQAWMGCPDGVPLELAPDELHEWVRQGAYAFLTALHGTETDGVL